MNDVKENSGKNQVMNDHQRNLTTLTNDHITKVVAREDHQRNLKEKKKQMNQVIPKTTNNLGFISDIYKQITFISIS